MNLIQQAEFKCQECGEILTSLLGCTKHTIEWKHRKFMLLGAEIIHHIGNTP